MKKLRIIAVAVTLALACILIPANAFGSTIYVETLLQNASFELGNQPIAPGDQVGCPIDWACTGSPTPGFTSYVVTSAQYTAGSDGLAAGLIVPDGTRAATSPTMVEGSGTLEQITSSVWTANTYVLDLWVGTPKTLPSDNTTPVGSVGTLRLYILGNGSALQSIDLTIPSPGQWVLDSVSFTPTAAQLGETIGIELFVSSTPATGGSGNNRIVNLDMVQPTSQTPEPASFALIGLGLIGIGLIGRRRSAHK